MANREQLAWAAGVFEGEGCVGNMQGKGKTLPRIILSVVQRDPWLPTQFLGIVGVGKIYVADVQGRPMYRFRTAKYEYVQAIIAQLWPWLGPVKKAQATAKLTHYIRSRHR